MKKKRKLLSLMLCTAMLAAAGCSGGTSASGGGADKSTPQTAAEQTAENEFLSAAETAKAMGIGLNLGNTMEAYNAQNCEKITYEWIPTVGSNVPADYETCWGAVVTTQEIIDGIKAEGFNTVRIPVFWGNMMENDGKWDISPEYMARVREIVDYCQNAGVYAVINIHHFDEFIIRRNSVEECEKIFNHLWTQIAEEFKDHPETVVFAGFNEYLGGNQFNSEGELVELSLSDGYKLTNALNQAFVDAVRATGGNNTERVLIVSGYRTNIDRTTSDQFVMPKDSAKDKLMVSVHYVDNAMYWSNKIGGKEWTDYINSQCELLKKSFTDKGIPVFVGETTSIYPKGNFAPDAEEKDTSKCLEMVLDKLTDEGFVPVLWDVNGNFYSRTEYRIISDSDREVIKKISEKLKQ